MSLPEETLLGSSVFSLSPAATDFSDSLQNTPVTINGISTTRRNTLAALLIPTKATLVEIDVVNNAFGTTQAECGIAYRIDGGPVANLMTCTSLGVDRFQIVLDGKQHTLEVWDGFQAWTTGIVGTFIYQVRANAPISFVQRGTTAVSLAGYGDSILDGAVAPVTAVLGWFAKVKGNYTGARVSLEAWSGRQLFDDLVGGVVGPGSVAGMASRLVGLVAGSPTRIIWDQIGVNDCVNATYTKAAFQAAKASLWDQIHADDPGITIKAQTLTITGNEGFTNANGDTFPDFRTAVVNAAVGRSWVQVVTGPNLCAASGIESSSPKLHPTFNGHRAIYNGDGPSAGSQNAKGILGF